ncbi:hypothetical protein [Kitasatospora arboriphila]|uniref:Uncharacterized protein n=1 Tax=Kitasatospora arboriphila TaxID=258052 RepID=A0ABN1U5M7_9ACTN
MGSIGTAGSVLTAWMRTLDAPGLGRVLAARPDAVAGPVPRSPGELAERLQRPGSVSAALHRVPLPGVQAAEALSALADPTGTGDLAVFLGVPLPDLEETLQVLAQHALVWPDSQNRLHMAAALRRMWPAPLGLKPGLEQLAGAKTSDSSRHRRHDCRASGTKRCR